MENRDRVEQQISPANRLRSTADGGNLLQRNADARMREVACETNGYGPFGGPNPDFARMERDWAARSEFREHFCMPGGMTFKRGSVLPEDR